MEEVLLREAGDEAVDIDMDVLFKGSFLGDGFGELPFGKEGHDAEDGASSLDEEFERALGQLDVEERRQVGKKSKRRDQILMSPMSFEEASMFAAEGENLPVLATEPGENAAPTAAAAAAAASPEHATPPPRVAIASDLALLHRSSSSANEFLQVEAQPPLEIRTRTKNENRTFSCVVRVLKVPSAECCSATVELCYATDTDTVVPTLGGTLTKPIAAGGRVSFDDLSVSVASPKHAEKEFVLRITLDSAGKAKSLASGAVKAEAGAAQRVCVFSTPFYAFSHKSVLKRRREVTLRALSHAVVSRSAGPSQTLHVVGTPFVRSDRLQCVFRVKRAECDEACLRALEQSEPGRAALSGERGPHDDEWISLPAPNLEVFSESVLFFQAPPELLACSLDMAAFVQVTNDGRNFSNPMPVMYIAADAPPLPKRQCNLRSRM